MPHTHLNMTRRDRETLLTAAKGNLTRRVPRATPITRLTRGERAPLSFAQQRLWLAEQVGETAGAYHVRRRLRLRGELDREALRRALACIVSRHDVLRTTFVKEDDEPEQLIARPEAYRLQLVEHELVGDEHA